MKMRIVVLLLAALVASSALADSSIYKWVDKDGNVHYSTVPQNPQAQPIDIVNTAGDQAPAASTAPGAVSMAASTQALATITPDDSAACKSARETLTKYLSAAYLYTSGANGEQQKLSPQQQDMTVIAAKNAVTQACSAKEPPP